MTEVAPIDKEEEYGNGIDCFQWEQGEDTNWDGNDTGTLDGIDIL